MIKQGDIFIVDFGDKYNSEFGKNRPALIIQSNDLNEIIYEMEYKSIAVIPLTTNLINNAFFRLRLNSRDNLKKDSDIVCNWVCTVDFNRLNSEKLLTKLTTKELSMVKEKLKYLFN